MAQGSFARMGGLGELYESPEVTMLAVYCWPQLWMLLWANMIFSGICNRGKPSTCLPLEKLVVQFASPSNVARSKATMANDVDFS